MAAVAAIAMNAAVVMDRVLFIYFVGMLLCFFTLFLEFICFNGVRRSFSSRLLKRRDDNCRAALVELLALFRRRGHTIGASGAIAGSRHLESGCAAHDHFAFDQQLVEFG